MFLNMEYLGES